MWLFLLKALLLSMAVTGVLWTTGYWYTHKHRNMDFTDTLQACFHETFIGNIHDCVHLLTLFSVVFFISVLSSALL